MLKSKKMKKNVKKGKKFQVVFVVVLVLMLGLISFLFLNKSNLLTGGEKISTEVISATSYVVHYDEQGNEIRTNSDTNETTIIKKEDRPTLDPEEQAIYESESARKQEEFDIIRNNIYEKYEAGDIDDEKYSELLKNAYEEQITQDENELFLLNKHTLIIAKDKFLAANNERFMQEMSFLYNEYHAVVNLDNDSYFNKDSAEVILYISDFDKKDEEAIRARFANIFGTDEFTFKKGQ